MSERRERLHHIASLNLNHIGHVLGSEKLRPVAHQTKLRLRVKDLFDSSECIAFPIGTSDHEATSVVAGRAAADVAVVERVHVHDLNVVVASLLYLGKRTTRLAPHAGPARQMNMACRCSGWR